jgi:hypothetical protein
VPPEHLYFDRCLAGHDSDLMYGNTTPTAVGTPWIPQGVDLSAVIVAFNLNVNHCMVHQCYFGGLFDGYNAGGEPKCIAGVGGNCYALQQNYFEAVGISVLWAGGTLAPGNIPSNIVYESCVSAKPTSWLRHTWCRKVKNHYEHKAGQFIVSRNNLHLFNWQGYVEQQAGMNIKATAGDQGQQMPMPFLPKLLYPNTGTPFVPNNPVSGVAAWTITTDWYVHDNVAYNVGICFSTNLGTAPQPLNYQERFKVRNNLFFMNPRVIPNVPPLLATQQMAPYVTQADPMMEMIWDHNSFICNMDAGVNHNPITSPGPGAFTNYGGSLSMQWGYSVVLDRSTVTNNLFDLRARYGSQLIQASGGFNTGPNFPGFFTNTTWAGNMTTRDNINWISTPPLAWAPGRPVTLDQAGFANMALVQAPTITGFTPSGYQPVAPPLSSSDWNITSGPLATASTTGGPIGSISP